VRRTVHSRVNFAGANCFYVDLLNAKLEGSILAGAVLLGAHLEGAQFDRASLGQADITGALLSARKQAKFCVTLRIIWHRQSSESPAETFDSMALHKKQEALCLELGNKDGLQASMATRP
jgi:pentapeptide repeat protein